MSSSSREPAFVFNCDYNGLSLIQSLGRRDVPVYALDSKRSVGTFSRYAKHQKVPDPLVDEAGFIDALTHIQTAVEGKPVLFPTNDHWAEAVARHKDQLSKQFSCCVSEYETVSLLLDKERFGRWCGDVGLPAPHVWSVEEALNEGPDLPFPVAVKANARRKAGQGAEQRGWARAADRLRFRPCADEAELQDVIDEANRYNVPVFVQQVIRGRSDAMHSIGLYAREGKILGLVYGKKLRGFPPGFGDCVVGLASPAPGWALELAEKASAALSYTGLAEFDVIVDTANEERYLIEINPRSWGWVGVAAPAGVDLASIAYRNLAYDEVPSEVQLGCADGSPVYYAKLLADLQNTQLWYRFSDARDWVLPPSQWWKTFNGRRGVFAEFSKDDPLVTAYSVAAAAKQFGSRLKGVLKGQRF